VSQSGIRRRSSSAVVTADEVCHAGGRGFESRRSRSLILLHLRRFRRFGAPTPTTLARLRPPRYGGFARGRRGVDVGRNGSVWANRWSVGPIAETVGTTAGWAPSARRDADVRLGRRKRAVPWRDHQWASLALVGKALGVLVLFVVLGYAVFTVGPGNDFLNVDQPCQDSEVACNVVIEVGATGLLLLFALATFVFWRVRIVANRYRRLARDEAPELLPTATHVRKVVGRDALCRIIENDLAVAESRPQVIVGGAGTGKTAVLVRLTERLASRRRLGDLLRRRRRYVPIPLALREVPAQDLRFLELAKRKFLSRIDRWALTDDEAEKIWRQLCDERRVVVLADGLDEALLGSTARERTIQLAVEEAKDDDLPLVIASRPDDVLSGLDVAVIELEELSANEAVTYIAEGSRDGDRDTVLDNTRAVAVEAAVVELPLYVQLAHELNRLGRLPDLKPDGNRLSLRVQLLDKWIDGLLQGHLPRDLQVLSRPADRKLAIWGLEGMACAAVSTNQLEVRFEQLSRNPRIDEDGELSRKARLVARTGESLELVEAQDDAVRFRDTLMEAYLGARRMPRVLRDTNNRRRRLRAPGRDGTVGRLQGLVDRLLPPDDLDEALQDPGRELLMSLVFCCTRTEDPDIRRKLRERVLQAARNPQLSGTTAFNLIAAAYEIDRIVEGEATAELGEIACDAWTRGSEDGSNGHVAHSDPTTEAKLRAIARIGECRSEDAYRVLWEICKHETTYRVRVEAAQEFARGSGQAFDVLEQASAGAPAPQDLFHERGVQQSDVRLCSLRAWTMPLLVASCDSQRQARALAALEDHVRSIEGEVERGLHLGVEGYLAQGFKWEANHRPDSEAQATHRDALIPLATRLFDQAQWWYPQVSLLQAFALWSLSTERQTSRQLAERIREARASEGHPFVREAARLCEKAIRSGRLPTGRRQQEPSKYAEPSRYLWIDEVGVAAKIGTSAKSASPRSYVLTPLWITGAVGWEALDPGAQQLVADIILFLNLIERGELAEGGAARVARRPEPWREREERRRRVAEQGITVPPCLHHGQDRPRLGINSGGSGEMRPGDGCPDGCPFRLCPYPPHDSQLFRTELREMFCRAQRGLLGARVPGGIPRWQKRSWGSQRLHGRKDREELQQFWTDMEARAQR
jgi:hypothetical protein